nr:CbrC family protein [Streptomyces sp. GS7]
MVSDAACVCCGKKRGYVYAGPVYAAEEPDGRLCPWCIAGGSAAGRYEAHFSGDVVGDDVAREVLPRRWENQLSRLCRGVERTLDGAPASALFEIGRGSLTSLEKYFPGKGFVTRSLSGIVKGINSAGDGAGRRLRAGPTRRPCIQCN